MRESPHPLGTTGACPDIASVMNHATASRQITRLVKAGIASWRLSTFNLGQGVHYILVQHDFEPDTTLRTVADVDRHIETTVV